MAKNHAINGIHQFWIVESLLGPLNEIRDFDEQTSRNLQRLLRCCSRGSLFGPILD